MTADNYLFLFLVAIFMLTIYGIITNTNTEEERDAMLNDEDVWF